MISVFSDKSHYHDKDRKHLTHIMRAHWNDRTPEVCEDTYRVRFTGFRVVDDIQNADIALLPMYWNYYVEKGKIPLADAFIETAHQAGVVPVIYITGDFHIRTPYPDALIIEASPYRSNRQAHHHVFISGFADLVPQYFDNEWHALEKTEHPRVGFCGQSAQSLYDEARLIAVNLNNMRRLRAQPEGKFYSNLPVWPWTRLRRRLLDTLRAAPTIADDFIIRRKYRAGVTDAEARDKHRTRIEFLQNMYDNAYMVCVRGRGNFSKRFYETMCLGRIPVFLDTDAVLPFDYAINWDEHCVMIQPHEMNHVAEKVADFHNSLTPEQFMELQARNRQIWLDYLYEDSFYHRFQEFIDLYRQHKQQ